MNNIILNKTIIRLVGINYDELAKGVYLITTRKRNTPACTIIANKAKTRNTAGPCSNKIITISIYLRCTLYRYIDDLEFIYVYIVIRTYNTQTKAYSVDMCEVAKFCHSEIIFE